MNEDMGRIHITEADSAKDFVAEIKPVEGPGRSIDECMALAKARGSEATLDEDFEKDLDEIVAHRRPLDTSVWD
jgi:hypothetical protein